MARDQLGRDIFARGAPERLSARTKVANWNPDMWMIQVKSFSVSKATFCITG